jgi:glycolate oxidase FAD binding subunit
MAACAALPSPTAVMTFSVLPSLVAETIEQGTGIARQRGLASAWTAHAGVGIVTAALGVAGQQPDAAAVVAVLTDWRAMARAGGGHATLVGAPLAVKSQVPVWDDPGAAARIMQRIKAQLDPGNVLNPGRFVAGI